MDHIQSRAVICDVLRLYLSFRFYNHFTHFNNFLILTFPEKVHSSERGKKRIVHWFNKDSDLHKMVVVWKHGELVQYNGYISLYCRYTESMVNVLWSFYEP